MKYTALFLLLLSSSLFAESERKNIQLNLKEAIAHGFEFKVKRDDKLRVINIKSPKQLNDKPITKFMVGIDSTHDVIGHKELTTSGEQKYKEFEIICEINDCSKMVIKISYKKKLGLNPWLSKTDVYYLHIGGSIK